MYHQLVEKLKEVVHYWKFEVDDIDDDESQGIQLKEFEGECTLEGKATEIVALDYGCMIKTKKHNISTEEAPKMAIIGDYWDKYTIT